MKFKLKRIETINRSNYVGKVYDLTVQDDHSYNIKGIVVHNSMCTTRRQTGCGVPNVTALMGCVSEAEKFDVPIIADGGIRYPGDVAKAIACGAESVMLGSLLAGTFESPGEIQKIGVWPNEQLYKKYRGSASLEAKLATGQNDKHVEGVSRLVPYKGHVGRIINDIVDGLKSSMSYLGASTIQEFIHNAEFVRVTNAGQIEASPHGLEDLL
jgi:IMP dehydrogenase